jgi:hypothetical protein
MIVFAVVRVAAVVAAFAVAVSALSLLSPRRRALIFDRQPTQVEPILCAGNGC